MKRTLTALMARREHIYLTAVFVFAVWAQLLAAKPQAASLCHELSPPAKETARELAKQELPYQTTEALNLQTGLASSLKVFDEIVAQSTTAREQVCALERQQDSLHAEERALRADGDRYNQSCPMRAKDAKCTNWYADLVNRQEALLSKKRALDAQYAAFQQQVAGLLSRLDTVNTEIEGKTMMLCALEVPDLQTEFSSLTQQIEIDRQIVHNFGFEKTTEEIEQWGALPAAQIEDAKKEFKQMLFDASLASATRGAEIVGSLTRQEVELLNRLADAEGAPPLGIVAGARDVGTALKFLEKTKTSYSGLSSAKQGHMLDAAVKLGGLFLKNPAYGLLLSADEWALYQVYQSTNAVLKVGHLTELNEGDLKLLRQRSDQLKSEVSKLKDIKSKLSPFARVCDSTHLVEKPSR